MAIYSQVAYDWSVYISLFRRCPIAWLFDGLTDRLENRIENRAVGAHNWTIVCDFEQPDGVWHVRVDRMDHIRLFISIVARNALRDKHNKNRMRSVGQWELKIGWNLSKHESHQITSLNSNYITLFKIGQWLY